MNARQHGGGGEFFKGEDFRLREKRQFQITDVELKTLGIGKDAQEKFVLTFNGQDKQFALNQGNKFFLIEDFGEETDGWIGHRVEIECRMVRNPQGGQCQGLVICRTDAKPNRPQGQPANLEKTEVDKPIPKELPPDIPF